MFPSTCLTILLSRYENTNCTRHYLVKQPVQVLLRVEKKMKRSYALSSSPSFVLAHRAGVFFKGNSVFDSPQVSGSFNVQDGRIALLPKFMDRAANKPALQATFDFGL